MPATISVNFATRPEIESASPPANKSVRASTLKELLDSEAYGRRTNLAVLTGTSIATLSSSTSFSTAVLLPATNQRAGLMTAQDKINLDDQISTERWRTNIAALTSTVVVTLSSSTSNINLGRTTLLEATTARAGVMTAEDKYNLVQLLTAWRGGLFPTPPTNIDYLVVAGGGGGGGSSGLLNSSFRRFGGGGGGAGGFRSGTITGGLTQFTNINIEIGGGGIGGTANTNNAGSAGNSTIGPVVATGGGGGGGCLGGAGGAGGSGGGAGGTVADGSNANGGAGIAGQGKIGGRSWPITGENAADAGPGGGGGSNSLTGEGVNGTTSSSGGAGGNGSSWFTFGTFSAGGAGGSGGSDGSDNSGNGGGGGLNQSKGGNGGRGIVIIRYLANAPRATGGNISTIDGYVYHTFYSSGNFRGIS